MGTRLGYDLGTRCVFPSLPSPSLPLLRVFADIPSSEATPSRVQGSLVENNVISWDRDDNSWFASLWRDIQLYFSSVLFEVYPRREARDKWDIFFYHFWFIYQLIYLLPYLLVIFSVVKANMEEMVKALYLLLKTFLFFPKNYILK